MNVILSTAQNYYSENFAKANKTTRLIIAVQALLFTLLIVFGISGSSISKIRDFAPGLVSMDEKILIGNPKVIRSDEWGVNSLTSIGQYQNKESKNPSINSNLGPTPRKMSIIHDTGVPTSELSTLSKINLWGFFIFDLRRALAWDWWIPVLVGLNGIWLLLSLICPGQSLFNFSLALLFTLAPECVLWSNWPLLHIGTSSFAVSLAIIAFNCRNILLKLTLALLTGLLTSWFILQLYLPRLIPISLISVGTFAGYCFTHRVKFYTKGNCLFIAYAALIAFCLLFDWLYHNYDAIDRMLNSAYPGQRRVYGGAPVSMWDFNYVRGWLYPITSREDFFANYTQMPGNPCEAMSYLSLFVPITVALLIYVFKSYHRINCIFLFNFILLELFVAYEYTGIPEIIGKLTLLNRTTPARNIIGVGFTSLILLAFIYKYRNIINVKHKFILLCFYLVPFIIFVQKNKELIEFFRQNYVSSLIYITISVITAHAIFLYRTKYIALAMLLFTAPVTLFWNPIIVAPSYINVNLPRELSNQKDLKYNGRFLIADNFPVSNLFLASGHKVLNATSNYVDSYMFDNFYAKLDEPQKYNSFNHLVISIDNLHPDMSISMGLGGFINMRLNALGFDFSKFPVDYVVARKSPFIDDLNSNTKLTFVDIVGDFYFYRVKQ